MRLPCIRSGNLFKICEKVELLNIGKTVKEISHVLRAYCFMHKQIWLKNTENACEMQEYSSATAFRRMFKQLH
jgi:hypothetical protein